MAPTRPAPSSNKTDAAYRHGKVQKRAEKKASSKRHASLTKPERQEAIVKQQMALAEEKKKEQDEEKKREAEIDEQKLHEWQSKRLAEGGDLSLVTRLETAEAIIFSKSKAEEEMKQTLAKKGEELKTTMARLGEEEKAGKEKEEKLTGLEAELVAMKALFEAAKKENGEMKGRVADLETDKLALLSDCEQTKQLGSSLEQSARDYERRMTTEVDEQKERTRLANERADGLAMKLEEVKEYAQSKYSSLEAAKAKEEEQSKVKETELENVKQDLVRCKADLESEKKLKNELDQKAGISVHGLEAQVAELKEQLKQSNSAREAETTRYNVEVNALRHHYSQQIEAQDSALKDAKDAFSTLRDRKDSQEQQHTQEMKGVRAELQKAHRDLMLRGSTKSSQLSGMARQYQNTIRGKDDEIRALADLKRKWAKRMKKQAKEISVLKDEVEDEQENVRNEQHLLKRYVQCVKDVSAEEIERREIELDLHEANEGLMKDLMSGTNSTSRSDMQEAEDRLWDLEAVIAVRESDIGSIEREFREDIKAHLHGQRAYRKRLKELRVEKREKREVQKKLRRRKIAAEVRTRMGATNFRSKVSKKTAAKPNSPKYRKTKALAYKGNAGSYNAAFDRPCGKVEQVVGAKKLYALHDSLLKNVAINDRMPFDKLKSMINLLGLPRRPPGSQPAVALPATSGINAAFGIPAALANMNDNAKKRSAPDEFFAPREPKRLDTSSRPIMPCKTRQPWTVSAAPPAEAPPAGELDDDSDEEL